jgi:hypothetical protein
MLGKPAHRHGVEALKLLFLFAVGVLLLLLLPLPHLLLLARASAIAPQAQHQVQRALFLNVVVAQGATILQLLPGKNQALLVRGDAWQCGNVRKK